MSSRPLGIVRRDEEPRQTETHLRGRGNPGAEKRARREESIQITREIRDSCRILPAVAAEVASLRDATKACENQLNFIDIAILKDPSATKTNYTHLYIKRMKRMSAELSPSRLLSSRLFL